MTTIAWDGKYLASDSLVTQNGLVDKKTQKIHTFQETITKSVVMTGGYPTIETKTSSETLVIAGVGRFDYIKYVRENKLYDIRQPENRKKINLELPKDKDGYGEFGIVLISSLDPTTLYFFAHNQYSSSIYTKPHSWGSGEDFARGAMKFGASAFEAVEIASEFDTLTDNKVQYYDFEKKILNLDCLNN